MITCDLCTFQLRDDPSFKPSGGRLGENDMDYDTDDKTMATLRRQLRRAHEEYYRCKRYGGINQKRMILLFDSCVSLSNIQYNQFSLEFIWKLEV
jgi:hypothetical protein